MISREKMLEVQKDNFEKEVSCSNRPKIKMVYTKDLLSTRKMLAATPKDSQNVDRNTINLRSYNGTVALGKRIDDTINVLISSKVFEYDDFSWIGTVYHECTHAYDYYHFAKHNGIQNTDDIDRMEYYREFFLWTEFHARSNGFRAIVNRYGIDMVSTIELLHNSIRSTMDDYTFVQYCGRLAVLREMGGGIDADPLVFWKGHYADNEASILAGLSEFFIDHSSFELVKDKFPALRYLLLSASFIARQKVW